MARPKVRYFVEKPGKSGARYFWQPAKILRAMGWEPERLPDDRGQALARAERLNAELDAWRKGSPLPPTAATSDAASPAAAAAPAILAKDGPVRTGSIAWLIRQYKASRFFTLKAAKTQKGYNENLRFIEDWAGDAPIQAIGKARVQKLYEDLRIKTPAKANAVITMLRIVLRHAERLELVKANAADNPGMISQPFAGKLWPIDAVSLFVETADRMNLHSLGTAVVINHWIGQREGDIIDLGKGAWRGGRFHLTQSKTDTRVSIPHSPWVEARVEAELKMQEKRGVVSTTHLLLCEATGQSWKQSTFQKEFARVRAAAALEWATFEIDAENSVDMVELWFMHLRHTAVTELALAGCEIPEIAAITGHTLKSVYTILRRYLVMTSALADRAAAKRLGLATEIASLKNHL